MTEPATKPLWFLDVDGVVNCFPSPRIEQILANQDWAHVEVKFYRIWYRQVVVDFIRRMVDEDLVDVLWTTTWKGMAAEVLAPLLGLGAYGYVGDDSGTEDPAQIHWWKLQRVLEIAGTRPFVWTDDDLKESPWASSMISASFPQPTLLLSPNSNPALEDAHLVAIEAFLRSLHG